LRLNTVHEFIGVAEYWLSGRCTSDVSFLHEAAAVFRMRAIANGGIGEKKMDSERKKICRPVVRERAALCPEYLRTCGREPAPAIEV
jgi:hypothetical protein